MRAMMLICPLTWKTCLSTENLRAHLHMDPSMTIQMMSVFSQTVKSSTANFLRSVANTTPQEPVDHARFSHMANVDWEKTARTAIYPTQSLSRPRVVKTLERSSADHKRRQPAARVQTVGAARSLCEAARMTRLAHDLLIKITLVSKMKVGMGISPTRVAWTLQDAPSCQDKLGEMALGQHSTLTIWKSCSLHRRHVPPCLAT